MSATLISLATTIGAPLVKKILENKIGGPKARLAGEVMDMIAQRVGVPVQDLPTIAAQEPAAIEGAMIDVEGMAPELIELYAQGLEGQFALLQADMQKPNWYSAWRPLWMYFLALLWAWNIIILHLINAIMKWALPPMDMSVLLGLTSIFMALYMGGHTLKDAMRSWKAVR
ncbi:MAG: hypothetical protein AAGM84_05530 [Pseudomonadota bacterium]